MTHSLPVVWNSVGWNKDQVQTQMDKLAQQQKIHQTQIDELTLQQKNRKNMVKQEDKISSTKSSVPNNTEEMERILELKLQAHDLSQQQTRLQAQSEQISKDHDKTVTWAQHMFYWFVTILLGMFAVTWFWNRKADAAMHNINQVKDDAEARGKN